MLPDNLKSAASIQQIAVGSTAPVAGAENQFPHVLLVVDGFPKVLGGGERIVLQLAELLPRYGFRASILTLRLHPGGEFDPATAPCPVYLLPLTNTYGIAALRGASALRRFVKQQNICLVETFFESSDIWAGFVIRFFSKAKLIWSRRDLGILRGAKHRLAYRALRRCPHAVVAVSKRVAEHVVNIDGVPASKVHVVYNGLNVTSPAERTYGNACFSGQNCTVTTVGNVRHVKGHDLLVQAAQHITKRYPDVSFTVAGEVLEPGYHRELEDIITASGMGERFRWLGKVNGISAHLATSQIFVLPSRSEGFSNALIEAMAAGLAVVATDVGGNGEAIENGVNGLLIPPDDVGALTHAIESLLVDPEMAARLGAAARDTVQRRFTSDAMMRAVTGVFASVL